MTIATKPKLTALQIVKKFVLDERYVFKSDWKNSSLYPDHSKRMQRLQEKRVRQLSKAGEVDAQLIASAIDKCQPSSRCENDACAYCSSKLQNWFANACDIMWLDNSIELAFVSIIPSVIRENGRQEPCRTLDDARRVLLQGLRRADITIALGALDLSWNSSSTADGERPCWHFRALASRWELRDGRRALAEAFPSGADVPRPVQVQSCDGRPEGFAYLLKPDFHRRLKIQGGRGERNTRSRPLTAAQEVATCLELDRSGIDARLVLIGVRPFVIKKEVHLKNYVEQEIRKGIDGSIHSGELEWHQITEEGFRYVSAH